MWQYPIYNYVYHPLALFPPHAADLIWFGTEMQTPSAACLPYSCINRRQRRVLSFPCKKLKYTIQVDETFCVYYFLFSTVCLWNCRLMWSSTVDILSYRLLNCFVDHESLLLIKEIPIWSRLHLFKVIIQFLGKYNYSLLFYFKTWEDYDAVEERKKKG